LYAEAEASRQVVVPTLFPPLPLAVVLFALARIRQVANSPVAQVLRRSNFPPHAPAVEKESHVEPVETNAPVVTANGVIPAKFNREPMAIVPPEGISPLTISNPTFPMLMFSPHKISSIASLLVVNPSTRKTHLAVEPSRP
jgi:hypothetical protein